MMVTDRRTITGRMAVMDGADADKTNVGTVMAVMIRAVRLRIIMDAAVMIP
jgi:hypothetical protein